VLVLFTVNKIATILQSAFERPQWGRGMMASIVLESYCDYEVQKLRQLQNMRLYDRLENSVYHVWRRGHVCRIAQRDSHKKWSYTG
jgi:hypothetical protein